jgi:hypothetical protein
MSPSAITVTGGAVTFAPVGGFGAAIATIGVSGGTATFNVATNTPSLSLSGGTLNGTGLVTLTGASTWSGGTLASNLTVNSGATFALNGGVKSLGALTLTNNGTVAWSAGQVRPVGNSTVNNNAVFDIQGDLVWGKVAFDGGSNFTTVFNNAVGATLQKSAGTGVLNLGSQDSFGTLGYLDLNNSGTVSVLTGTMNVLGTAMTQNGLMQVAAGTVFQRTGGFTNGTSGTLAGAGTIDVGAGNTLTNNGTIAPGIATGDTTGTLSITGNLVLAGTGTVLTQFDSTTAGDFDRIAVSGSVTYGGTLTLSGAATTGTIIAITSASRVGTTTFTTVNGTLSGTPTYSGTGLTFIFAVAGQWTGLGDGFTWTDTGNWGASTLPGVSDNVVISAAFIAASASTQAITTFLQDLQPTVGLPDKWQPLKKVNLVLDLPQHFH